MRPYIVKVKCAAQENICPPIKDCPNNAIYYITDDDEPIGGRIEFNYEICGGCGKCVDVCCGNCIEMR